MSSEQQSDNASSSGRPQPPKPPLPGEDPNLVINVSSRVSGNISVPGGETHVEGDVAGREVDRETIQSWNAEQKVTRTRAGLFLALIVLGALLYFVLQYIFR